MKELLTPDDSRDALRKIGGLLFGLGILMLLLRKASFEQEDPFGDGLQFILWLIPAVILFGASLVSKDDTGGRLRAWQTVYSVFGLIFVTGALLQLVELIDDGASGNSLNVAWIFGVVAALAFYSGFTRGIRFQFLFGSIALIIAWSALWDKILGDEGIGGHVGVYRGLLGILAIGLLVGALYLWRTNPGGNNNAATTTDPGGDQGLWKASELFTGAGISAVLACSLGIASIANILNPLGTTPVGAAETSWFWDTLLLVISLGLVGIGAQIGLRGPIYIGAIGLTLFLLIAGFDLDEGAEADPTSVGVWPILLLVLGGLGILLSGVKEASLGDRPKQLIDNLRKG
jgi:hypothetical protein